MRSTLHAFCALAILLPCGCAAGTGARVVERHGFPRCVEFSNKETTVTLEPDCGGRVLVYARRGTNVLYVDPVHDREGGIGVKCRFHPCAGRFDIGPEMTVPWHPALWRGRWEAEIVAPRAARMISRHDESTGVRLTREFSLDEEASHLRCTQTITNLSAQTKRYCHWSRTFAVGGGICLVPLNPRSRYPKGYIIYGPGDVMDYKPKGEPGIRTRDGVLEIIGAPERAKFAIDSFAGWIAYLTTGGTLFVKKFAAHPERVYGEMAGNPVSIWYKDDVVCEIEPIGPMETIEPGASASFTEDWYLLDFPYPADKTVDLDRIRRLVAGLSASTDR